MANAHQKISVNLSNQVLDTLRSMAAEDAVTVTEMLRRAISTQKFIEDAQREGKRVYLHDPQTNQSERVLFR